MNDQYCQRCINEGQHRLIYVVPELDDSGKIVENGTPTIIQKVIKPKKIKGPENSSYRCERCMKY